MLPGADSVACKIPTDNILIDTIQLNCCSIHLWQLINWINNFWVWKIIEKFLNEMNEFVSRGFALYIIHISDVILWIGQVTGMKISGMKIWI